MKALRMVLPALVLSLATSAFAQDVSYNFDPQVDFTKYKTYKWEKHPQSADVDQLTVSQLGAAFDRELGLKGLARVDSGEVDMVMVFQFAVKQEKELTSFSSGWNTGGFYGGGWYGGGGMTSSTTTTSVSTITIGTIAVDMYDVSTKELVWRGIASKTLDVKAKPEKREKNMAKAAQKLFKNYPPPKKKK